MMSTLFLLSIFSNISVLDIYIFFKKQFCLKRVHFIKLQSSPLKKSIADLTLQTSQHYSIHEITSVILELFLHYVRIHLILTGQLSLSL